MARTAGVRRLADLPKFEDWTPPWKEGEFDAEKAKKLIYDLHNDKQSLFKVIDERDAEIENLEDEADEADAKAAAAAQGQQQGKPGEESEIAQLRREIADLKAGNAEKPKSRREQREERKAAEKAGSEGGDLTAEKYRIALEKGLSAADARRLVGNTVEELEADADTFLADHGGKQDGGKGGQAPPSNRPKPKPRTGTGADQVEDDDISDPGKLWDSIAG